MILHVDMDAFYASVEQRDKPELAGKPVIVGGTPQNRGVVAAANYEARAYGIRSAMPSSVAVRLCPHAVIIPMRMDHYVNVSSEIRDIFYRYTPLVEPLSLDEAFLDVEASTQLHGSPETIAGKIKEDIQKELNLTASVGIASNKFLAKIASDLEKPDGLVSVPSPCQSFLDPLPVTRLWGIGKVASANLKDIGVRTIRDFRLHDLNALKSCVGHSVDRLLQLATGVDARKVEFESTPKSISRETTFATDIENIEALESTLLKLTEDVAARLRKKSMSARTIGIKLRYSDFTTITRDETQSSPTDVTQTIWTIVRQQLHTTLSDKNFKIRLAGVRVGSLESHFDDPADLFNHIKLKRQKKVDAVVDQINKRFGKSTVRRGGGVGSEE